MGFEVAARRLLGAGEDLLGGGTLKDFEYELNAVRQLLPTLPKEVDGPMPELLDNELPTATLEALDPLPALDEREMDAFSALMGQLRLPEGQTFALLRARRRSTGKVVAVVVVSSQQGDEVKIVPVAVLCAYDEMADLDPEAHHRLDGPAA